MIRDYFAYSRPLQLVHLAGSLLLYECLNVSSWVRRRAGSGSVCVYFGPPRLSHRPRTTSTTASGPAVPSFLNSKFSGSDLSYQLSAHRYNTGISPVRSLSPIISCLYSHATQKSSYGAKASGFNRLIPETQPSVYRDNSSQSKSRADTRSHTCREKGEHI